MDYLIFAYRGNSRELKRIIAAILKSGLADNVKKMNYVQDFCLNDKKVEKTEEKLLIIHTDNYDKLIDFVSKNFPQIIKLKLN